MKNSTNPTVCNNESVVENDNKELEKAKPTADEHPVAKDEASKGKKALDCVDFVRDARIKVLLYKLDGRISGWVERGTGLVACVQSRDKPDAWWIVVRSKYSKTNVLESRILLDTIYKHMPQGTDIVWSEPDVGKLWLSFFEKAGCTKILDKICQIQLEAKLGNSPEAQLWQTSENNRKLTAELNTLQAKNREILEKNRNLEQELSKSQVKVRDLEAKLQQTKLSNENEMKNHELSGLQKRFDESEKRIAAMSKGKEKMAEELKSWKDWHGGFTKYTEQLCQPRLDPKVPQAASQSSDEGGD